jgi:hypothetical protein
MWMVKESVDGKCGYTCTKGRLNILFNIIIILYRT